jgi:hypothetical protein
VLRALARLGLVYEPDFTEEMMDALHVGDQPELFALVGFGPPDRDAAHALADYGWPLLCEALGVSDEIRDTTHAMLVGEADG